MFLDELAPASRLLARPAAEAARHLRQPALVACQVPTRALKRLVHGRLAAQSAGCAHVQGWGSTNSGSEW